jgi:hypothetical protein
METSARGGEASGARSLFLEGKDIRALFNRFSAFGGDVTKIEEKLNAIFELSNGWLFRTIHEELVAIRLRPKDNNKTVLYHFSSRANGQNSLAAFRVEPDKVFSLPKAYWENGNGEREDILARFSEHELKSPNPKSPSENKSGGQILITEGTLARIVELIRGDLASRVPR